MDEKLIAETVRRVLSEGKASRTINQMPIDSKSVQAVTAEPRGMTLALALALVEKVEKRAEEQGMRIVTAVADSAGRPVAIHCMDGAYVGSFDVALNKAYTAVAFQMSTEELGRLAQPGAPLYGIQNTNEGKIVIFGGGEPLTKAGLLVGAVGVSGGNAEQDTGLAAYARDKWKEVISCL